MIRIPARPNGFEMSRPASPRLVSHTSQRLAGGVGSIELLGAAYWRVGLRLYSVRLWHDASVWIAYSGVGIGMRVGGAPGGLGSGGPRSSILPSSNDRPTRGDKGIRAGSASTPA